MAEKTPILISLFLLIEPKEPSNNGGHSELRCSGECALFYMPCGKAERDKNGCQDKGCLWGQTLMIVHDILYI